MRIIKKTDEKIVFASTMSESVANALRRSIGKIPTMAIEELEISKNDSALYDETIAHRMGLLPLKMKKEWKEGDEVKLKLSYKNPGIVYAEEIKGDAEVVFPRTPITLLRENQELKIKATAQMGIGRDHSKFNPGVMFYRNICEISLPKEFEETIKKIYPDRDYKTKGDKIVLIDDKDKPIVDFCEGLCEKNKTKAEIKDSNELIITVESFGQMSPEDVFKAAVEVLKKDLKEVPKNLK